MEFSFTLLIHGCLLGPYYSYTVEVVTRGRAKAPFPRICARHFELISCIGEIAHNVCRIFSWVRAHLLS